MEFIEASFDKLVSEVDQTVFSHVSAEYSTSSKAKEAQDETKTGDETVPHLVYLDASRGWITEQKFRKSVGHNSHPLNGPTYESNWIIPKVEGSTFGSLCVGSYPEMRKGYLVKLIAAGCNTFVCLNDEYGTTDKYGDYYEPYATNSPVIHPNRFIHKKIKDMGVGSDEDLEEVATTVAERIKRGENVYLHCAGGHGRTGSYTAMSLHKLFPELSSSEIFEYIQFAHDQRDGNICGTSMWTKKMLMDPWAHHFKPGQVPSPQTLDQRNQVRSLFGERLFT